MLKMFKKLFGKKDEVYKEKRIKKKIDTELDYIEQMENYKKILIRMLSHVHCISNKKYIKDNGIFPESLKELKINDKFKKHSIYFDDSAVFTTNIKFKMRYLSFVISFVINNILAIAEFMHDNLSLYEKYNKYTSRCLYIEKIIGEIGECIEIAYTNKDSENNLFALHELVTAITSDVKMSKRFKRAYDMTEHTDILKLLATDLFIDRELFIDILLKVSSLVTNNAKKLDIPLHEFEDMDLDDESIYMLIKYLGEYIIDHEQSLTIPFMFFIRSNPKIITRWEDTEFDNGVFMGILALSYYSFIVEDKKVSKVIRSFIA